MANSCGILNLKCSGSKHASAMKNGITQFLCCLLTLLDEFCSAFTEDSVVFITSSPLDLKEFGVFPFCALSELMNFC